MSSRSALASAHRIVVKVGTHVVTHDGVDLALGRMMDIIESLARLRRSGHEMVLVTSGAVGLGMRELGLTERPRSLGLRQACAAVGQGHLMGIYTRAFSQLGVKTAQVLLTQEDLGDRDRALCIRTTLMRLMELGAVPIINENDSVSVRELMEYQNGQGKGGVFGDNDMLSAIVATALDADALIMLTNVPGLLTAPPGSVPAPERIPQLLGVAAVSEAMAQMQAVPGGKSSGGTGGMASKLEAARLAIGQGTAVVIAVEQILNGDDVGTFIAPESERPARWRRIAVSGKQQGALVINEGALRALNDQKASLLPIGVVGVDGEFEKGDLVEIRDGSGRVHGRGLVNYDAAACRALMGRQSDDIVNVLGFSSYDALITRDNLVMGSL
jgi:glutamate 5-kinase